MPTGWLLYNICVGRIRNKKLAARILKMAKADQEMRIRFMNGKGEWDSKLDKRNTEKLKEIIGKHGWPTTSAVGKRASNAAWLLAQHADHNHKFQKKVLSMMKETYKQDPEEIAPRNIAYLTDRTLIHEKKRQLFGTQFRESQKKKGVLEPFPIRDKKNINKRRRAYGLPSLGENTREIKKAYSGKRTK